MKINAVTVQNEVDTTHRRIAFMRGQPFNSDSEDRWKSIVEVSREMGITIDPKLVVQLEKDISSPELGYQVMQQLLAQHLRFTAVVAFNYMSAIVRHSRPARLRPARAGRCFCHRARRHSRRRLQQSTSDHDIRQPLTQMGRTAAQCALNRLLGSEPFREQITFEPKLVVRKSTQAVKSSVRASARESRATQL